MGLPDLEREIRRYKVEGVLCGGVTFLHAAAIGAAIVTGYYELVPLLTPAALGFANYTRKIPDSIKRLREICSDSED